MRSLDINLIVMVNQLLKGSKKGRTCLVHEEGHFCY